MTRVTTGANLFRARLTLKAADIFGLDAAPINIVPAEAGKTFLALAIMTTYNFGTTQFTLGASAAASIFYGPLNSGVQPCTTDVLAVAIDGTTQSKFVTFYDQMDSLDENLIDVESLGLYLVNTHTGFAASGGNGTVEIDLLYQVLPD